MVYFGLAYQRRGNDVTYYRDGPSLDCRGSPFSQPQWLVPTIRQCFLSTFQASNYLLNLLLKCLKLPKVGEKKKHFMSHIHECYNQNYLFFI